jgi:hypothetical protein
MEIESSQNFWETGCNSEEGFAKFPTELMIFATNEKSLTAASLPGWKCHCCIGTGCGSDAILLN